MSLILIATFIVVAIITWPIIKRFFRISTKAIDKKLDEIENKFESKWLKTTKTKESWNMDSKSFYYIRNKIISYNEVNSKRKEILYYGRKH